MTGYGSDYSHDGRQQSQNFGGYNAATIMYNVPQATAQTPVYDTQQFGSRQPAALQMMTPDVASTYFGSADNASAHSLQTAAAAGPSGTHGVYQQNPSMSYNSSMTGVSPSVQQAGADVSMNDDTDYAADRNQALEEKWHNFQRQLSTVFQDISNGALDTASDTLLSISGWLLSQVADLGKVPNPKPPQRPLQTSTRRPGLVSGTVQLLVCRAGRTLMRTCLGLTMDDASLHADRIKLWDNFNHAWLALGQKQVDLMSSRPQQSRSQHLLSQETIEHLGNELVRLCDGLERHGLIDYQYGVWEDQIVAGKVFSPWVPRARRANPPS